MLSIPNPLCTTRGQQQPEQLLLRVWPLQVDVRMEVIRAKKSRRMESKNEDTRHQNIAGKGKSF